MYYLFNNNNNSNNNTHNLLNNKHKEPTYLSNAQRGNGIGGKGSQNETRALRTMPSREKQGF